MSNVQTNVKTSLQENEAISQKNFQPQSIIIKENSEIKQLIIIHQGEIAYYDPMVKEYIFAVPAKNFIPTFSFLFSPSDYPNRLITTKSSIISAFPVAKSKGIKNIILGKLNIGLMALNSMDKETHLLFLSLKKLMDFYKIVNVFVCNLSLCFYKFQPSLIEELKETEDILDKNLLSIKQIKEKFIELENQIPSQITKEWLMQNNFYFNSDSSDFDYDNHLFEHLFLKRIVNLPMELKGNLLKTDLLLLENIAKKYHKLQSLLLQEIREIIHAIQEDIRSLIEGEYSLIEKFSMLIDLMESGETEINPNEFLEVLKYLKEKFETIYVNYQKAFFKKMPVPPSFSKIKTKIQEKIEKSVSSQSQSEESRKSGSIQVTGDHQSVFEDVNDSYLKILNFCEISNEEVTKMKNGLMELRKLKNPLESEPEIRRLKRPVIEIFWKAYEKAFLKYNDSRGNVPRVVQLFLLYGFFDDKFLEKEQIIELYDLFDATEPVRQDFSIKNSIEWLTYIAERKEIPSINELGESYFDIIKRENQGLKVKKLEQVPPDIDSLERRVRHEVKNFVSINSKLVSGSPTTYFPILTKFHIIAPKLKDLFVSKERISKELIRLLEIDFSAFYRELVLNDEERKIFKEFVMVNVYPHLILLPSVGNKSMMWQELEDYRRKSSPARLAFPIFSTGDLFTMLVEAVGAFRWEIQKTILGHDYNNVGIPSLTSEYIDYIQFYHKNRNLSEEQKEKIKQDFKNFRDDKSKFVHDYSLWVKYESQGILKLNKVVRNILYRYVPFSKGIRENLKKQPAYAEIHNRFRNIRMKKVNELESKWKKYGDKSKWPASLKLTYEYYSS